MNKYFKYIVILVGSIVWSLTMFRSGLMINNNIGFFGANGHDGIWHLTIISSLSKGNLNMPVFSGEIIKNYHVGYDVFVAMLHRLTTIDISVLYFQVLPFVFSFLIGLLVYHFVLNWKKDEASAVWATLFTYFSGSLGFLVTLYKDGLVSGESVFWSQQALSTLVNPPYAMSLVFILLGLVALQNKKTLLSIIFFGLLLQIKAYSAILVLAGLFIVSVYSYLKNKSTFYLKVFLGSLIINVVLLFSVKNDSVSIFEFMPFWFLETMMSYSDRLGIEKYYSAMTNYKLGDVYFKLIASYSVAFVIFVVGNLGIRLFSIKYYFDLLRKKVKVDEFNVFITTILLVSLAIPMLFIQKGTPWNTIQFFYYFQFFVGILAGISFNQIISKLKNNSKYIVYAVMFLIFVINSYVTLQHYLPKMPQAVISKEEFEALNFLKQSAKGITLTYPFDQYRSKEALKKPPRPVYLYESTGYVSYYGDTTTFLSDEVNLNIMGYNWKERREKVLEFFESSDPTFSKKFLEDNNISYLYLTRDNPNMYGVTLKLSPGDINLETIFENTKVTIYRYKEESI